MLVVLDGLLWLFEIIWYSYLTWSKVVVYVSHIPEQTLKICKWCRCLSNSSPVVHFNEQWMIYTDLFFFWLFLWRMYITRISSLSVWIGCTFGLGLVFDNKIIKRITYPLSHSWKNVQFFLETWIWSCRNFLLLVVVVGVKELYIECKIDVSIILMYSPLSNFE